MGVGGQKMVVIVCDTQIKNFGAGTIINHDKTQGIESEYQLGRKEYVNVNEIGYNGKKGRIEQMSVVLMLKFLLIHVDDQKF